MYVHTQRHMKVEFGANINASWAVVPTNIFAVT